MLPKEPIRTATSPSDLDADPTTGETWCRACGWYRAECDHDDDAPKPKKDDDANDFTYRGRVYRT